MNIPTEELELHDARKPRDQQLAAPASNDMLEVIQRAARDPSVDMDKMERLLAMAALIGLTQSSKLADISIDVLAINAYLVADSMMAGRQR